MTMHADLDVTLSRLRLGFGVDSLTIRVCDEATADELTDAFAEAARRLNRRDREQTQSRVEAQ